MKFIKKLVLLFLFISIIPSCINLKDEYPEFHFYRLTQFPGSSSEMNLGTTKGSLQVRDFTASEEIDDESLTAIYDKIKVKKYFYHRWISNLSDMFTEFIINRYSKVNVFEGGVIRPGSLIIPNYILEGQILDMGFFVNEDSNDGNYAEISIRITLLKRDEMNTNNSVILNKIYTVRHPVDSDDVELIPIAYSRALSQITDQMLIEIINTIIDNY